jgi:chromosome partitioning protein
MSTIIAIGNQKGGVAKTTSTFNLAYALVEQGQRVLCIDADPQASLTEYFGCDSVDLGAKKQTLYFGLVGDEPTPLSQLVQGDNPALIAANITLAQAEADLRAQQAIPPQTVLRKQLRAVREQYDYILIDCQPSLGILPVNALAAANLVLIPVEPTRLATASLPDFFDTLRTVRRHLNAELTVWGIRPTRYDGRKRHHGEQLAQIQAFGQQQHVPVLEPVKFTTMFERASDEGKPVTAMGNGLNIIENYQRIAAQLIAAKAKVEGTHV